MADSAFQANRQALELHGTPLARAIADSLGRFDEDALDEAERTGIAAIEQRRADLLADESIIEGYDDLTVRRATAGASKKPLEARLIFMFVRAIRPESALELGANMGISAAYQALALRLNGTGRLVSLEGSKGRAALAAETVAPYGTAEVRVGRFDRVLGVTLEDLGGVDYAFVDGHHLRDPTLAYFEQILARTRRPGVLLFDDIHHNPEMDEAWAVIAADERVAFASDFGRLGLCLIETDQ